MATEVGPPAFIHAGVLGFIGEGMEFQARFQAPHGHDDGGTVDAAGKGAAHRNIASKVEGDAFQETFPQFRRRPASGQVEGFTQRRGPEAPGLGLGCGASKVHFQIVPREQLADRRNSVPLPLSVRLERRKLHSPCGSTSLARPGKARRERSSDPNTRPSRHRAR